MMKKSSSLENEPCCSKACKKNTDNLNSKIIELSNKLDDKEGLGYSAVPPPIAQIYSSPKKDLSWTGLPEFADDTHAVKFMKATERSTSNKVEAMKKPSMRYVELYRKPSKKPTVRGNQRNWNNLKSQQLGENFVRKNRACFNCGHFNHLAYDCGLGVKNGRTCPTGKIRRCSEDKKKQRNKKLEDSEAEHQV
nr:ubiquitin hydrolase [Tanacetum cinerariifolium]